MKKIRFLALLGLLLFIIDRTTKYLALNIPQEGVFLNDYIGLKLFYNPGIAFSIPLPNILNIFLAVIILAGLIYFLINSFYQKKLILSLPLALVIIGSASNLIDRFRFGAVVDFISLSFWPAFNLADCYIVIGIILLIFNLKHYSAGASKTVIGEASAKQDCSK
ncbi:signal peptidase II [Patescibacteria group bacterium]|nr:signal peptidase II [Patescibacteria group bacterium]